MDNVPKHSFNRAALASQEDAAAIVNQRGGEYGDTWAVENVYAPRIKSVCRTIGFPEPDAEQARLLMAAALCDVKTSRWMGPFNYDTPIDEINYLGALAQWLGEYVAMRCKGIAPGQEE